MDIRIYGVQNMVTTTRAKYIRNIASNVPRYSGYKAYKPSAVRRLTSAKGNGLPASSRAPASSPPSRGEIELPARCQRPKLHRSVDDLRAAHIGGYGPIGFLNGRWDRRRGRRRTIVHLRATAHDLRPFDQRPKLDSHRPGDPQEGVEGWLSEFPLHTAHHRVGQACPLGDRVHREPQRETLVTEKAHEICTDELWL